MDKNFSVDDILAELDQLNKTCDTSDPSTKNSCDDSYDENDNYIDNILNEILNESKEKKSDNYHKTENNNNNIKLNINKDIDTSKESKTFYNPKLDNKYSMDSKEDVSSNKIKVGQKHNKEFVNNEKKDSSNYSGYLNKEGDSLDIDELLNDIAKKNLRKAIKLPIHFEERIEKKSSYQLAWEKFQQSRKNKTKAFMQILKLDKINKNQDKHSELDLEKDQILYDNSSGYRFHQRDEFDNYKNKYDDILTEPLSILKNIKILKTNFIFRLSCLIVLFLLNFYYTLSDIYSSIPIFDFLNINNNSIVFVIFNLGFLLMAMVLSYPTIMEGIIAFIKFEPDRDSIVSISVLACFIQNFIMLFFADSLLNSNIYLYTPIGIGILLFNAIGKLFIIERTLDNYKIVYSDIDKSVLDIELNEELTIDLTRGVNITEPVLGTNKNVNLFDDFIEKSFGIDIVDRLVKFISPVSILLALFVSFFVGVKNSSFEIGMVVFTGIICMFSPFSLITSIHIPFWLVNKKLKQSEAAIIGISDIEDYGHVNCIFIDAYDLFPEDSIVLNGIETFSGKRIDEAIIDAASVVCQSKSILSNIFMNILLNRKELLKSIDSVIYEDKMGLSAWIENRRILIGTRELLINHGVKVPIKKPEDRYHGTNTKAIYLSTCGELTAIFIVTLHGDEFVLEKFKGLQDNNIYSIIKTIDPILSSEFMTMLFDVDPEFIKIIDSRQHIKYNESIKPNDNIPGTVLNNRTSDSYMHSILAAKRFKTTIIINVIILLLCMFLGVFIVSVLGLFDGLSQMSVSTFILYQVLWTIPSYFITKFRKQ